MIWCQTQTESGEGQNLQFCSGTQASNLSFCFLSFLTIWFCSGQWLPTSQMQMISIANQMQMIQNNLRKCKFFLWLVEHDKCWTVDCLARRGLPCPERCPLWDQEQETINHLLVSCPFARQHWYSLPMLSWACLAYKPWLKVLLVDLVWEKNNVCWLISHGL